jgi:hypothetical protein
MVTAAVTVPANGRAEAGQGAAARVILPEPQLGKRCTIPTRHSRSYTATSEEESWFLTARAMALA